MRNIKNAMSWLRDAVDEDMEDESEGKDLIITHLQALDDLMAYVSDKRESGEGS